MAGSNHKNAKTGRTNSELDRALLLMLPPGILLSVLPMLADMALPVTLLAALLGLWQMLIIGYRLKNPARLVQILILLVCFAALVFSYGYVIGRQAGVALLTLMTLLKLFETKTHRDCYIIVYSCLFITASNFFQSQSVWLMLYVFAVVIYLLSLLIALSDRRHSLGHAGHLRLAGRLGLYALPFMLVLFVLFPRIPGPLWGLPDDAFSASTGLGEEMSPGSINQLVSSSAIAFRVKFHGQVPPQPQRYWRALVLSSYDGRTWRRDDAPASALPNLEYGEKQALIYDYTITLEPHNHHWLPTLQYPLPATDNRRVLMSGPAHRFSREALLLSKEPVTHALNYRLRSQANTLNRSLFDRESYKNRLLPAGRNPQTLALAKQLLESSHYQAPAYIRRVLQYFRDNDFVYTLNPGSLGENAMDDFLFGSRRGFCEHYASAFTYLMRAAGIPARVVIGYQGGQMNPLDEYMIVRQSDAHAWTEIWYGTRDNGYWKRIDPTAAVSPDRIERGVQNAGLDSAGLPLLLAPGNPLLKQLAFFYDSLQHQWNQWVIGYDQDKQASLLRALGLEGKASDLVLLLTVFMGLGALLVAWLLLRQKTRERDRVQYHYRRLCSRLARRGVRRNDAEGPRDYEKRVLQTLDLKPAQRSQLQFVFRAYRALHYGNHNNPKLEKLFISRARNF